MVPSIIPVLSKLYRIHRMYSGTVDAGCKNMSDTYKNIVCNSQRCSYNRHQGFIQERDTPGGK